MNYEYVCIYTDYSYIKTMENRNVGFCINNMA